MNATEQLIEALAMVEFWRTECEQQRTRAEAAEQVIREVSVMLAQAQELLANG